MSIKPGDSTVINGVSGPINLTSSDGSITISPDSPNPGDIDLIAVGGGGGVNTINGETGAITIQSSGATIVVTEPSTGVINLEAVGGGGGVTSLNGINGVMNLTSPGGTLTFNVDGQDLEIDVASAGGFWDRNTGTSPPELSPTTAGDVVLISSGSAANPGMAFVGDNNSGIFNPTSNTLGFSVNGQETSRYGSAGTLRLNIAPGDADYNTWNAFNENTINFEASGTSPTVFLAGRIGDDAITPVGSSVTIGAAGYRLDSNINNRPAQDVIWQSGPGTGTGGESEGSHIFQIPIGGASGKVVNAMGDVLHITREAELRLYETVGGANYSQITCISNLETAIRGSGDQNSNHAFYIGVPNSGAVTARDGIFSAGGYRQNSVAVNRTGDNTVVAGAPGSGSSDRGGEVEIRVAEIGTSGTTPQNVVSHCFFKRDGSIEHSLGGSNKTSLQSFGIGDYGIFGTEADTYLLAGRRGVFNTVPPSDVYVGASGWTSDSNVGNRPGSTFYLRNGAPTGNSGSGRDVIVQATNIGASGTTPQSFVDVMRFLPDQVELGEGKNLWIATDTETLNFKGSSDATNSRLYLGRLGSGSTNPTQNVYLGNPGFVVNSNVANRPGSNTFYLSGAPTGNSTANGDHIWQTPDAGVSGTDPQTFTTKMSLLKEGILNLNLPGSAAAPIITLNNEPGLGFFAPTASELGFARAGGQIMRLGVLGTDDLIEFGLPGGGATAPKGAVFRAVGYESDSTVANRPGPDLSYLGGRGTGDALSGGFKWKIYTPTISGTTVQSANIDAMELSGIGNLSVNRSGFDSQIYIGTNDSEKPTALSGPALIMKQVTTDPTGMTSGFGSLFLNTSGVWQVIDGGGTVRTINVT